MKIAFVFSGQGAQVVGMGKDLYESAPAAAAVFNAADAALGWSVSGTCFSGPEEKLVRTRYCQPAIFTMSAACLAAFQERFPSVEPVGVAGLSLGEFAAMFAAGVFSFEDGVKLVARRGEWMEDACAATKGAMASVLGGDPEVIRTVCREMEIDVANYNCPGQIVISGAAAGVERAVGALKEKGMRKVIPLNVAGAYHSRLMKSAEERFSAYLREASFATPRTPVAQNFVGAAVTDAAALKSNCARQVTGSVRWEECVRALRALGAEALVEFGPGNVLTGLARRVDPELKLFNVNGASGLDAFSCS